MILFLQLLATTKIDCAAKKSSNSQQKSTAGSDLVDQTNVASIVPSSQPLESSIGSKSMRSSTYRTSVDLYLEKLDFFTGREKNYCDLDQSEDFVESCYEKSTQTNQHVGEDPKSFCCFHRQMMICIRDAVKKFCVEEIFLQMLDPETERGYSFRVELNKWEFCRQYSDFWHCGNGVLIVAGSATGIVGIFLMLIIGCCIYRCCRRKDRGFLARNIHKAPSVISAKIPPPDETP